MASGWSAVRAQIQSTLEASPLSLVRVKRGISEISGQGESGAGAALYKNGYFITPRAMNRGERLQLVSTEREMQFEIYTGCRATPDTNVGSDTLIERCELIIKQLRNCNVNVPAAVLVELNGDVRYLENPDEPDQLLAVLPFRTLYFMTT